MNNRIEELFKQAGGKTTTHSLASNPVQYREIRELWDDHIEKFAELIVRECANYMYENYPDTRYKVNYMRKHMGDPEWHTTLETINNKKDNTFVCPPEENGSNMFSKYDGDGW